MRNISKEISPLQYLLFFNYFFTLLCFPGLGITKKISFLDPSWSPTILVRYILSTGIKLLFKKKLT